MRSSFCLVLFLASLLGNANAQTGTLDQVSPNGSGLFWVGSTWNVWQAQVRAGIAGQLEGVTVTTGAGSVGQTLGVRLRLGPGWNTSQAIFDTTIAKQSAGEEQIFVDMLSAGLTLNVDDVFVIEFQGLGTGTTIKGTYTPPPGTPPYPEPMFGGPGPCYNNCEDRIAFETWVLGEFASVCFGDGTQSVPCPCGYSGAPGHGCANSAVAGGAALSATGVSSLDSVVLHARGELPNSLTIFLQGDQAIAPVSFGDGLRCAGGVLKRLYVKSASDGAVAAPQSGDPSIRARSAQLGDTITTGSTRLYQSYYRDSNTTFCPSGNTYNITNAVQINW
jgi:hypothetical protein